MAIDIDDGPRLVAEAATPLGVLHGNLFQAWMLGSIWLSDCHTVNTIGHSPPRIAEEERQEAKRLLVAIRDSREMVQSIRLIDRADRDGGTGNGLARAMALLEEVHTAIEFVQFRHPLGPDRLPAALAAFKAIEKRARSIRDFLGLAQSPEWREAVGLPAGATCHTVAPPERSPGPTGSGGLEKRSPAPIWDKLDPLHWDTFHAVRELRASETKPARRDRIVGLLIAQGKAEKSAVERRIKDLVDWGVFRKGVAGKAKPVWMPKDVIEKGVAACPPGCGPSSVD